MGHSFRQPLGIDTCAYAGTAEGWRGVLSAWTDYRAEAAEYREIDDERRSVPLR